MRVVRTQSSGQENVEQDSDETTRLRAQLDTTAASALTVMLRGRPHSAFEKRLIDTLHAEVFKRKEDLRSSEQCEMSYERLRHLGRSLQLDPRALLEDLDQLLALHEWTAVLDGTVTTLLTIHFNLCIGSIVQHGEGRPELEPFLDELARMDTIGVFLATELAYGNNVQSLETEAVYDPGTRDFVLHTPTRAAQKFMPNTGAPSIPKLAVVMARLKVADRDCGVYPFIVRIRTAEGLCAGVRVTALGEKPDFALDNAVTSFDHVRVPFSQWLRGGHSQIDAEGAFSSAIKARRLRFMHSMDRVQTGKLCLSAAAVGMASAAVKLTLKYAQQRKTFAPMGKDVPILSYRSYQQTVFEAAATSYASALFVKHTKELAESRLTGDVALNRVLAMCKVFTSSRAIQVLTTCRERVGAQGMFSANRIVSYLIQVKGIVTAEGDNELLLIKAGRELLQASDYAEPSDVGATPPTLLESIDYLVSLVRARERSLVLKLRQSIASSSKQMSQFDAWNAHLGETIELAALHGVRLAVEVFDRALDTVVDPAARAIADRLARLFALSEIAKFTTPLLLDGLIEPELARRIGAERSRLAGELSSDARAITESFDAPMALLGSPIGEDFMAAYDFMGRPPVIESMVVQRDPALVHEADEALSALRGGPGGFVPSE